MTKEVVHSPMHDCRLPCNNICYRHSLNTPSFPRIRTYLCHNAWVHCSRYFTLAVYATHTHTITLRQPDEHIAECVAGKCTLHGARERKHVNALSFNHWKYRLKSEPSCIETTHAAHLSAWIVFMLRNDPKKWNCLVWFKRGLWWWKYGYV